MNVVRTVKRNILNGVLIANKLNRRKNIMTRDELLQNQHWCMCVKLKYVSLDGKSTCSMCGGRDAYGRSTERPEDKKKTID